jgi:hypothetical protein
MAPPPSPRGAHHEHAENVLDQILRVLRLNTSASQPVAKKRGVEVHESLPRSWVRFLAQSLQKAEGRFRHRNAPSAWVVVTSMRSAWARTRNKGSGA